ncbi:MAG TPA: hypothetical protein VKZ44_09605, partial [Taishania sp.]|nr:hypothetical protein [Taishania sp.]
MKKVYLGAFVLFAGMTVSAQQNLAPSKFSNFFPVEKKKVVVANNEKADVLWESTMDNQADWVSESISSNSSVTWVWKDNPSGIPQAAPDLYPFASATASNGFFVIDSDGNNNADFNGTQITATLTSPTIDLTGEDYVRLQFQHNFRWWKETRKVRISIDNGTTWQDLHIFSDNAQYYTAAQNTANPEITTIDISAIAGGQSDVKVQFFFDDHDYWGWYWVVDDVKILRNEEYDLSGNYKHNHFNGYEYSQIPATQVSPLTFEANAKNAGIEQLTGIQMTVDVNSGASTLTSNVLTLDANQEDTLSVTYNVPSTAGTYTFSQSISMDQTDLDMSNNLTFTPSTLTVGEFIYATDLGAPYAAANYSTITLNGVGVGYDIYNNATLYGIDFVLTTGTATDGSVEVYGELREYNTEASSQSELWNFVAETDPVIIASASDLDAVKTLSFPTPV